MKKLFIAALAAALLAAGSPAAAGRINVLIYAPGVRASDITVAQADEIIDKYTPDNWKSDPRWQELTRAQKARLVIPARIFRWNKPILLLKDALDKYELLVDFKVIAEQGGKFFVHALIERSAANTKQFKKIKDYIEAYNEGKAIQDQILYWADKTALGVYIKLWQSRNDDPFIMVIMKKILRYPVETTCDGQPCMRLMTIEEAESPPYNEVIDPQLIKIPHSFFGA